jgi:hypothetical protein
MIRFEIANTGCCVNTAEHGDALHRTDESRVIDQYRGDMVASQECTACVFCSHNEPCGATQQPRCLASLRTSRMHARYQPHRISQTQSEHDFERFQSRGYSSGQSFDSRCPEDRWGFRIYTSRYPSCPVRNRLGHRRDHDACSSRPAHFRCVCFTSKSISIRVDAPFPILLASSLGSSLTSCCQHVDLANRCLSPR